MVDRIDSRFMYREVVERIEGQLQKIGLESSDIDLNSTNILVPEITFSPDYKTRETVPKLGLSARLSVIYIAPRHGFYNDHTPQKDNRVVFSAGTKTEDREEESYGRKIIHTVRIGNLLKLSSPMISTVYGPQIAFIVSEDGSHLDLDQRENQFIIAPEKGIDLEKVGPSKLENALLFLRDKPGLIHITALTLPQRWRSAVENGHLVDKSLIDLDQGTKDDGRNEDTRSSARRRYTERFGRFGQNRGREEAFRISNRNSEASTVLNTLGKLFSTESGAVKTPADKGSIKDHDSAKAKERYWEEKANRGNRKKVEQRQSKKGKK